jgi:thioredoxin-related protein
MKVFAASFLICLLVASAFAGVPEYRTMGPDIFDAKEPAAYLVANAITQAQREDKKVLLLFGANWCPWCRRLHVALTKSPSVQSHLREKFVLVFIDANTRNYKRRNAAVIEQYGNPVRYGLPVFVVLDRSGTQLTTRETASMVADSDEEVAERVVTFLNAWSH